MKPWLAERASSTPTHPALQHGPNRLDYAALAEQSACRAEELARLGIGDGDRIAFSTAGNGATDALQTALLIHALMWRGAVLVPLAPSSTASRIRERLQRLGVRELTVDEMERIARADLDQAIEPGRLEPDSMLTLMFTSGSEGEPMAVPLTLRQHRASIAAITDRLALDGKDRWLCCLPLDHIAGLAILLRAVATGACVTLHDRFNATAVAAAVDNEGITRLSLVPTMLIDLLACHPEPFQSALKSVLVGGAPTEAELLQRARARGLPVLPTWGMTEAGSQLATPEPARAATVDFIRSPNWVGRPLSGVEVRVADDGRLQVRGPMLFSGALDDSSRGPDTDGWYTTGDRGRIDADGELTITGRAGRALISGGINVNLDAVERRLLAAMRDIHPVREVALIAVVDARWGQRIVAAVVAAGNRNNVDKGNDAGCDSLATLQDWARRNLDPAERPARWHRLAQLPRTSTGKIDYPQLTRQLDAAATDEA